MHVGSGSPCHHSVADSSYKFQSLIAEFRFLTYLISGENNTLSIVLMCIYKITLKNVMCITLLDSPSQNPKSLALFLEACLRSSNPPKYSDVPSSTKHQAEGFLLDVYTGIYEYLCFLQAYGR